MKNKFQSNIRVMENELPGPCSSAGVLRWECIGTDGFSQSLHSVIIILIVFLSSFFIRVTFTYRKCLLKKKRARKKKKSFCFPELVSFYYH